MIELIHALEHHDDNSTIAPTSCYPVIEIAPASFHRFVFPGIKLIGHLGLGSAHRKRVPGDVIHLKSEDYGNSDISDPPCGEVVFSLGYP
jgi:hypothetical protein